MGASGVESGGFDCEGSSAQRYPRGPTLQQLTNFRGLFNMQIDLRGDSDSDRAQKPIILISTQVILMQMVQRLHFKNK